MTEQTTTEQASQANQSSQAGQTDQTEDSTEQDGAQAKASMDDLKSALADLASAVTKLGEVVEGRARAGWEQAKPEVHKAIDELKGAVEAAARRASSALDGLGKKGDKDKPTDL